MRNHIVRRSTVIVLGLMLASCSSTEPQTPLAPQAPQADQVQVDAQRQVLQDATDEVQEAIVEEPVPIEAKEAMEASPFEVDHQTAESPDGRYRIETYGTNDVVTAGGYVPAEGIRIIARDDDRIVWSSEAMYHNRFLWSPDSRYIAITRQARTWGEAFIVDTADFSVIALPDQATLSMYWDNGAMSEQENGRSDPYYTVEEWPSHERLIVSFEWFGAGDDLYRGTYTYDAALQQIIEVEWR